MRTGANGHLSTRWPTGHLSTWWRIVTAVAWAAGFFAYAAVWQASVQLGIGTWWVGPRADPTPAIIRLLPFAICIGMCLVAAYGIRRVPAIGVASSVVLLLGAVPDFSRSTSLALTEVAVALALLAVSAVSVTGIETGQHVTEPAIHATDWGAPDPFERAATADHPSIGEPSSAER